MQLYTERKTNRRREINKDEEIKDRKKNNGEKQNRKKGEST